MIRMKVFIAFAHPEPQSLTASLRDVATSELTALGHEVQVSDLYAMGWKSNIDRSDFPTLAPDERMRVPYASGAAFLRGTLTDDVKAEQAKLLWADMMILQFPLWWYSMPAILKGWVERVYAAGFAYGVGVSDEHRGGDRYGEGVFAGKRAMLLVSVGGQPDNYSARGICGPIEDVLFPINHGILYYPGFDVLPPFIVWGTDRLDAAGFETASSALRDRMQTLETIAPIPYRPLNGGDYAFPGMTLRPELGTADASGFRLHERE
ncbi:NAD(P)H-dependent oxidoreductase [Sandaracinobacter sp. RS1-74]|uniref:NAD(P)H-dependent oxidoreductase n=1 Tax=Sandaracinobacteroides sayramensis TaxID=2913411 RepID=UPI001EDBC8F7|nr:NAD(P)H-dependent oxidoreductase [Sandaracinobacteroides sayramensis]MCG2841204.1 NAD(P)H-dependent oxidoreductase [Sandaracinobacteroides sayramensis]